MTSRFGPRPRRADPNIIGMHAGIDISATDKIVGTPVYSVLPGIVEMVGRDTDSERLQGYGNAVVVRHRDEPTWALYAHLKDLLVSEGQTLEAGTQVGSIGNSTNGRFSPRGNETQAAYRARAAREGGNPNIMSPHLHMEVRRALPGGGSPFPGPYPDTPAAARNHLDPAAWLRQKGMEISNRGAMTFRAKSTGTSDLGIGLFERGAYDPPSEQERDARFGLTKNEWRLVYGASAIAATTLLVFAVRKLRSGPALAANRKRYRLRAWGGR